MYDYFYGIQAEQFSFYRIPKLLFTHPAFKGMTTEAKTLYGILLDRMNLSAKNNWIDDAGRAYIIFKITGQELRALLETRIRRIFKLAAAEGNEVLILGAFGCGAFRNPPDVVADVFRQVTGEYRRQFETIEYAVFHTDRETENFPFS